MYPITITVASRQCCNACNPSLDNDLSLNLEIRLLPTSTVIYKAPKAGTKVAYTIDLLDEFFTDEANKLCLGYRLFKVLANFIIYTKYIGDLVRLFNGRGSGDFVESTIREETLLFCK